MNIELCEEAKEIAQIDSAIREAENEFNENGILLDARDVLSTLRKKYIE